MSQNDTLEFLKKNVVVFVIALASGLFFIFAAFQYFAPENIKPFKTAKSESSTSSKTADSKQSETKTTDSNTKSETIPVTANPTTDSALPTTSTTQPTTTTPTTTTQTSTPTPATNTDTYTNPYFPTLKIVYDKSWKFSTTTSNSDYKNVATRKILLQKNGKSITIYTTPIFPTGCESIDQPPAPKPTTKFSNGLNKYISGGKVSYSKDFDCSLSNILISNLLAKDSKDYQSFFKEDKYIRFIFSIFVEGVKADDSIVSEIDKIISDSKFN